MSQYHLARKWLNLPEDEQQTKTLKSQIIKSQLSDGSWYAVKDANRENDDNLDATIWNYLALQSMKDSLLDEACEKGKTFILKAGGIEKANMLSKTLLSAMGLFDWVQLPKIPQSLLQKDSWVTLSNFGQWVGPHLKAMIFLRKYRLQNDIGLDSNVLL